MCPFPLFVFQSFSFSSYPQLMETIKAVDCSDPGMISSVSLTGKNRQLEIWECGKKWMSEWQGRKREETRDAWVGEAR